MFPSSPKKHLQILSDLTQQLSHYKHVKRALWPKKDTDEVEKTQKLLYKFIKYWSLTMDLFFFAWYEGRYHKIKVDPATYSASFLAIKGAKAFNFATKQNYFKSTLATKPFYFQFQTSSNIDIKTSKIMHRIAFTKQQKQFLKPMVLKLEPPDISYYKTWYPFIFQEHAKD